jgi:predicted SprT family Zn-dependent metalloprotease
MNDSVFHAMAEWERQALHELHREYNSILSSRKLSLRRAMIEFSDSQIHWGEWHSQSRSIRLSRRLLQTHSWFKVLGVLRHEMAHQMVDEAPNPRLTDRSPHGEAFQWACRQLGVPMEFTRATADLQQDSLDWREEKRDEASEKMLEKVRKLLALASSGNEHEAVLAMNRVREMFAKYNLEQAALEKNSEFVHVAISTGRKRLEIFERKILGILTEHFFVQVLLGQTFEPAKAEHHRLIEIIGTRENAAMAEYVYHFLRQQSAVLVDELAKARGEKLSRIAKKSFRLGILSGFGDKLRAADKPQTESVIAKALVAFRGDPGLKDYIAMVYPKLRATRGRAPLVDPTAYSAGITKGQQINLHKPVHSSDGNRGRLLR